MPRSPLKSFVQAVDGGNSELGNLAKDQQSAMIEKSREHLASLPRPLVLDFECSESSRRPSPKIIGDFVILDLGLKPLDIVMIGQAGGPKNTVRLVTMQEIDVPSRFGNFLKYERTYGDLVWNCTIRGGSAVSSLRFLNVQYYATDEELLNAIAPFAVAKTQVSREVFMGETLIDGIWNGHKKVQVEIRPSAVVPDFVQIRGRKIYIQHRDQARRCFRCGVEGHIAKDCQLDPWARKEHTKIMIANNTVNVTSECHEGETADCSSNPDGVYGLNKPSPSEETVEEPTEMNQATRNGLAGQVEAHVDAASSAKELDAPSTRDQMPNCVLGVERNRDGPRSNRTRGYDVRNQRNHPMTTRGRSPTNNHNDPSRDGSEKQIQQKDPPLSTPSCVSEQIDKTKPHST